MKKLVLLLLLVPTVFADPNYGNGLYGNDTYGGIGLPPSVILTINPQIGAITVPVQIGCSGFDSNGVKDVLVRVDGTKECEITDAGTPELKCDFSYRPSEHNDVTKNYTVYCVVTNIFDLTTESSGHFFAIKDTGSGSSGGSFSVTGNLSVITKIDKNLVLKDIIILPEEGIEINVTATGSVLPGLPPARGTVVQYFLLSASRPYSLSSANLTFIVSKNWLETNNFRPSDVFLEQYNGGWEKLPTRMIGATADDYTFEAAVSVFSSFAVAAENIPDYAIEIEQPLPEQETLSEKGNELSPLIQYYALGLLSATRLQIYLISILPESIQLPDLSAVNLPDLSSLSEIQQDIIMLFLGLTALVIVNHSGSRIQKRHRHRHVRGLTIVDEKKK